MTATDSAQLDELLGSIVSGRVRLVDLTSTLTSSTPAMSLPEPFTNPSVFRLEELSRYDERGPFWLHHDIHAGEHTGTHLDAPIHWLTGKDGLDVASIPLERLVGPACVIDVRDRVEADPDFLLERSDVVAWEAEHGPLPSGSWLILRTGWERFADDADAFVNADESGAHTPGVSAECARWLAEETSISGYGVDTMGMDAGRAGELDPPYPMHYNLLGNDKYGIPSLRNLGELPERGAVLIVAPLRIAGATGSPARVLALVPNTPGA